MYCHRALAATVVLTLAAGLTALVGGPAAAETVVATIPLPAEASSMTVDEAGRRLYVLQSTNAGSSLSVLNLDTRAVLRTVALTEFTNSVAVDPGRGRLRLIGGDGGYGVRVTSRDLATLGVVGTPRDVAAYNTSTAPAVDPGTGTLYFAGYRLPDFKAGVTVVDPTAAPSTDTFIPTDATGDLGVVFDSTRSRLVLGGRSGVGVVDLGSGTFTGSVATSYTPWGFVYDPGTARAYLSGDPRRADGQFQIDAVDTGTLRVVATVPTLVNGGNQPNHASGNLALDPRTHRLATMGNSQSVTGLVEVVDTALSAVVSQVVVGDIYRGGIVADPGTSTFLLSGRVTPGDANTPGTPGLFVLGGTTNELTLANAAGGTGVPVATNTVATPDDPVGTSVTSTQGGPVRIVESTGTTPAPSAPIGYTLLDRQVVIDAPQQTIADPLVLSFVVDASLLRGPVTAETLAVIRDDVPVTAACTDPPGTATPDPCIASRTIAPDGDLTVTIRSSHASTWTFGGTRPALTTPTVGVTVINAAVGVPGVLLRAAIAPTTATGTVDFRVGTNVLPGCAARPVTQGTASCVTTLATAGSTTVTAAYSGDATLAPATGSTTVVVAARPTWLQLLFGYLFRLAAAFGLPGY